MTEGRRVCAWHPGGPVDIGPAPDLEEGQVTHGMCPPCARRVALEVAEAGGVGGSSSPQAATLAREKRAGV